MRRHPLLSRGCRAAAALLATSPVDSSCNVNMRRGACPDVSGASFASAVKYVAIAAVTAECPPASVPAAPPLDRSISCSFLQPR
ncbi:hypothetical protein B5X24_HaOG202708 [Helicoverpa armigera]|uniref:Uncharacterized protein n=1 Tax=Helicoverpa armigera TaxID=29058 RepID=A0A2W1BZ51_HELAM|nr:hypothetical protein B5X24_HaOG202708 [Helicoverpa armigera]